MPGRLCRDGQLLCPNKVEEATPHPPPWQHNKTLLKPRESKGTDAQETLTSCSRQHQASVRGQHPEAMCDVPNVDVDVVVCDGFVIILQTS